MPPLQIDFEKEAKGPRLVYFKEISRNHFEYQFAGLPLQRKIDGFDFEPIQPDGFGFDVEDFRNAKHLSVRDDDVLVLTYPKSGTTWIQNIVYQILHGKTAEIQYMASPMLEFFGPEYVEGLESPRIIKSHLRPEMLPNLSDAKVIFAARNPKDLCVSYYHHFKNMKAYECKDMEFDDFFEFFMDGTTSYGDYFEYLKRFFPLLSNANWYTVLYEDLLAEPRKHIEAMAKHLGVELNSTRLDEILKATSFNEMKTAANKFFPDEVFRNNEKDPDSPVNTHFRQGKSGDWRNWLTKSQSERMDQKCARALAGTVAENWWKEEMKWK
ncbi:unnamed protein product, partial [Mesorhabditis spiculigera]